jgi:hypothetical protein
MAFAVWKVRGGGMRSQDIVNIIAELEDLQRRAESSGLAALAVFLEAATVVAFDQIHVTTDMNRVPLRLN